jgi:PAS domain S-box-containing protein
VLRSVAVAEAAARALLESSAEGILISDHEGRIVLANPRVAEMFGYGATELAGQPVERLLPERFRTEHVAHRARYFAAPRARPMGRGLDLAGLRKDGTEFPIEISLSTFGHERERFALSLVTDITERKRTEDTLARLAVIVESSDDAIMSETTEGVILTWNRGAERIYGYRADEVVGHHFSLLVPPERAEEVPYIMEHLRQGKSLHHLETVRVRKDGQPVHVSLSISPIRDGGGRLTGAAAVWRDITGQRQLERAARQAEKLAALGTLSAGIAHEFNNPIGIITSRVELMLLDADAHGLPAEVRDDLRVIQHHAQRVSQIAKGLLSFARQSTGELKRLELNALIGQTLMFMQKQITKDGAELRTRLAPDLPAMLGDQNALQQVLVNLLTNARDAIAARGGQGAIDVVTEIAADPAGWVELVVADTGVGIPAEELSRLFDPFYTTKPRGTGLGLAVSYGIIRDHQGVVDVPSEPGVGTRFTVRFPPAP